jgi:hypothetical protein
LGHHRGTPGAEGAGELDRWRLEQHKLSSARGGWGGDPGHAAAVAPSSFALASVRGGAPAHGDGAMPYSWRWGLPLDTRIWDDVAAVGLGLLRAAIGRLVTRVLLGNAHLWT